MRENFENCYSCSNDLKHLDQSLFSHPQCLHQFSWGIQHLTVGLGFVSDGSKGPRDGESQEWILSPNRDNHSQESSDIPASKNKNMSTKHLTCACGLDALRTRRRELTRRRMPQSLAIQPTVWTQQPRSSN